MPQSKLEVVSANKGLIEFDFTTPSDWPWYAELSMSPKFYWSVHFGIEDVADAGGLPNGRGQLPISGLPARNLGIFDFYYYSVNGNPAAVRQHYRVAVNNVGDTRISIPDQTIAAALEGLNQDSIPILIRVAMNVEGAPWNSTLHSKKATI